jgi:two-component system, sensor histidine kinase and response regulator
MRSNGLVGANILIADDTVANLQVLVDMLGRRGCKLRPVNSGRLALQAARLNPPDLILLDVKMPDLDGYETCRQVKADAVLKEIPVLFISGLDQPMDKVKAFDAGGVDYITKPFQLAEVEARIGTHLRLRQIQRELEQHNAHLDEMVCLKTRQLAEAYQRLSILDKAKGDFLGLISHELRTPLNGLFGSAELLFDALPRTPESVELTDVFHESQRRLLTIVEHALLLTQINVAPGEFPSEPVSLDLAIASAVAEVTNFANRRNVKIDVALDHPVAVVGEAILLQKAMRALLETAVKFSTANETLRLQVQPLDNDIIVSIAARGRTIPDKAVERFFEVFSISDPITPGGDLGLAPAVAERIISLFGGRVSVENQDSTGVCLKMHLLSSSEGVSCSQKIGGHRS